VHGHVRTAVADCRPRSGAVHLLICNPDGPGAWPAVGGPPHQAVASGRRLMRELLAPAPLGELRTGNVRQVTAVAGLALPDGRIIAVVSGYDTTVRLWDREHGSVSRV
jgi:WD40 repeat protein